MVFRGAPIEAVEEAVTGFAKRGMRSLAVGRTRGDDDRYEFAAIISFLDPPRADTEETIHRAFALGVDVKMITGAATSVGVITMLHVHCPGWGCNSVSSTIACVAVMSCRSRPKAVFTSFACMQATNG